MFNSYLPAHYRYRAIFLAALSALLMLGITSYINHQNTQTSAHHIAEQYGASLTRLAAEQTAASTFNKDSISLQAIARQITTQSAASSIIVYDISNNILTQVSSITPEMAQEEVFYTAPIVTGDNIIGSITLGVIPSILTTPENHTLPAGIALILLLTMVVAYIKGRKEEVDNNSENSTEKKADQDITPTPDSNDNEITPKPANKIFSLLLQIRNTDLLYQQLNGESRSQQLEQLEHHIKQTMALYSGHVLSVSEGSFVVLFDTDHNSSIKHALYCGELILKLNQQDAKSIIVLNGFIQESDESYSARAMLSTIRKIIKHDKHTLLIEESLIERYQLEQELQLSEATKTPTAMVVEGFTGNYATLLQNQLTQLQHIDNETTAD